MELGASDTTEFDKMMGALGMLSGSKAGAKKAFDAASAMYAPVEEANPWEASLRFFLEMGKQASQPGATVLGSAVGSGLVPLDYLTAKKKEKRDRDQKVASTAFSLAPSLKPKAATYRDPKEYTIEMPIKDADGNITGYEKGYVDFLTAKGFADLQKQGARFSSVVKPTGTGSTTFGQYLLTTPEAIAAYKAQGPAFTLTPEQEAGTAPVTISANVLRTAGGFTKYEKPSTGEGTKTPKAYAVTEDNLTALNTKLGKNLQRNSDGNVLLLPDQFLLVQDLVGPEAPASKNEEAKTELAKLYDDLDLALAGSQEAVAIQAQIDDLIRTTGFNKEIFQAEREIRKEWNVKKVPFNKIESSHKKLITSLKRQSGVGDMSAIFVYMKMLDPGSVVRESEFAQAQQTAGAVEILIARMNQNAKGDKLSPDQRTEFLALADDFYKLAKKDLTGGRYELGTILQGNLALNPKNIFGKELAPASFYVDTDKFNSAIQVGFTMDEVWNAMSDAEKQAYGGQ